MIPPPSNPDACIHYWYHRATWGYDGGCPAESGCNHPDGSGDCCEEDCPYAKEGQEPTTHGDAYDSYCDDKFHAMRDEGLI